ncbi:MAG: hypothetical protein R2713_05965 [Ilumatobacteraceae bacterium]
MLGPLAPGGRRWRRCAPEPLQAARRGRDDRLGDCFASLGVSELDEHTVDVTLGAVLKYREDQEKVRQQGGIADIVKQAFERGAVRA